MKKVIREGVFETNSSSTHAVVFKKKKSDSPDNDSSYELHSPFMKTLFFIGLCTHADLYVKDYEEDCEYDLKQTDSNEKVVVEGPKSQCSRFMSALINEYVKMSNITQEEFEKQFNESVFTWDGECQCRNFFDDDVLCDCTCPFDGYYQITAELGLNQLTTDEEFAAKAKEFLSDDFKFVLQEYWQGCCLITKKEVY
jgi:hypothetical protein